MTSVQKILSLSDTPSTTFFDIESKDEKKMRDLSLSNSFDSACSKKDHTQFLGGIYTAKKPQGTCRLFKTLYTNVCKNDCKYCMNANRQKTLSYTPGELSKTFMSLYKNNLVDGLFLSSGIPKDPEPVMQKMVETVEIIRHKHNYCGYVHLKILPGASFDSVRQAARLADRVSINTESPSSSRMSELSSTKEYKTDILRRQQWLSKLNIPQGHTTQFVVGAADESDLEILKMLDWQYKRYNLRRGYFSAFTPLRGTAFENKKQENPIREHRLYNTDFLIRKYGYTLKDITIALDESGNLPKVDPKAAIAKATIDTPVDINTAEKSELIRIPGIGPKTAGNIIRARKARPINRRTDLKVCGVILRRAEPFLKLNGWTQSSLTGYKS